MRSFGSFSKQQKSGATGRENPKKKNEKQFRVERTKRPGKSSNDERDMGRDDDSEGGGRDSSDALKPDPFTVESRLTFIFFPRRKIVSSHLFLYIVIPFFFTIDK